MRLRDREGLREGGNKKDRIDNKDSAGHQMTLKYGDKKLYLHLRCKVRAINSNPFRITFDFTEGPESTGFRLSSTLFGSSFPHTEKRSGTSLRVQSVERRVAPPKAVEESVTMAQHVCTTFDDRATKDAESHIMIHVTKV